MRGLFPLRSLQTRILAAFLLLIVVVQVGGFFLVNTAGTAAARKSVGNEVEAGARVFDRVLAQSTARLLQGARILTSDYAFREAIATGDGGTVASALANHGRRIDADVMMLIGLDSVVVADTHAAAAGRPFAHPELLAIARERQQAAAMVVIGGELYQLVIVPVLAPLPIAWVAVGFAVNDALAQDLGRLTTLQVSFLSREGGDPWHLHASTLASAEREALVSDVGGNAWDSGADDRNPDGDAISRVVALPASDGGRVVAVLQESLSSALEPFRRLQRQLALFALLGVAVSIGASALMARGITRPVRNLAGVARRIAAGDYSNVPPSADARMDEIADLATAFRTMQEGIASRESRIMDLAYRDALTGLPNRALFADRLDQAVAFATRGQTPVAVLVLDLDNFKDVNDTLGHPIGDLLLREVAARIGSVVRRATDTVARLGGDEFALLLPGGDVGDAHQVADGILHALEAPMTLGGHVVDIRASIGIAACPDHGHEAVKLLRSADIAMYAAKQHNLGVAVWDDLYDRKNVDRLSLMGDLRKAVEQDEFTLVYQPKMTFAASGEHDVEALIRWKHPSRGLVPPAEFIPFAEHTGYIRAITRWVIARAVAQCSAWRREGLAINVSVNISARDLMDAELPDRFAALLASHGCLARWISLEITESAILDDPGHAVRNLERLNALGCRLAIDDYGTGYSSLAYLRRLPVHTLKIDKSFVAGMTRDASDAVIVRSTIDLAHNMGLLVVAEGVEDEPTLERLRALGCDSVQGFLVSRPLGPAEVSAWVRGSAWTRPFREVAGLRRVV